VSFNVALTRGLSTGKQGSKRSKSAAYYRTTFNWGQFSRSKTRVRKL
jgi:hypothetical protein